MHIFGIKNPSQRQRVIKGPKAKASWGIPKSPSKGAEQKAKGQRQNEMITWMRWDPVDNLSFPSLSNFFDLGLGPTSATIVFMDWMIKRAPHVESEPKGLSNHNKRKPSPSPHEFTKLKSRFLPPLTNPKIKN